MRQTCKLLIVGLAGLLLAASAGAQGDFARYVALGDSLTAGVVSYGLEESNQKGSFPALLAKQAGVPVFQQPTVSAPGMPLTLELKGLPLTSQGPSPVIVPKAGIGSPTNYALATPYNNLGLDGANLAAILGIKGDLTRLPEDLGRYSRGEVQVVVPMADLTLRDGAHTAVEQALALQPTILTVWAGNNDVLGAALVGVAMDSFTLTPAAVFKGQYETLLGTLHAGAPGAKIVVATIPDVTAIPFVTTVKPYLVNPADGSKIPLIGGAGLITDRDYLTLSASALLKQGIGVPLAAGGTGQPLPEGSVDGTGLHAGVILRAAEVEAIKVRTAELNTIIKTAAATVGARVVDTNAFFNDLSAHGLVVGGIKLSGAFLTGGVFSYDGVHPQSLGYALVANEFIKVMNTELGYNLPAVSVRDFFPMTQASTSVAASEVVFSSDAAIQMARAWFPGVDTSRLAVRQAPIRRHLAGRVGRSAEVPVEP